MRRLRDVVAKSMRDEDDIGRRHRYRALDEGVELIGVLQLSVLLEHQRKEVDLQSPALVDLRYSYLDGGGATLLEIARIIAQRRARSCISLHRVA